MVKWADYCITAVRYDVHRTHIAMVRARKDLGSKLGQEVEMSRSSVIALIDGGDAFVTAKKVEGKWMKGADVIVVTIGGVRYIKTEPNNTEVDNLGNLPEF